jgi:phage gp29-like protein
MSDILWEKANRVSELGYKVHSASMIVELVAEKISSDAESGALWAASEILQDYSERLEDLSSELMQINREQKEQEPKKKKK